MYRIGIIGAGGIADCHADAIEKNPECTIVAVADIVEKNAKRIADRFGARVYLDYHEMETDNIDIVMINLPHWLHMESACFFLKKGIAVYIEKPMAMSVSECDKMIDEAKKSNTMLIVGHVQQYTDAHTELKKIIDEKKLGKLLRITESRNTNYFDGRPNWFVDKKYSGGGIVMNYCAHTLDKIFYLTGDKLENACSVCTNRFNDKNVEEGAQVLAKFKSGMSGVFSYTGSRVHDEYSTYFYFEEGTIRIDYSVLLYVFENGKWVLKIDDDGEMFNRTINEMLKAIKGEKSMSTTPEHGRAVIEGIEKIYKNSL